MSLEDQRFYGKLLLVFGPLFIAGGWLAAFTDVGAVLIFVGAAMIWRRPCSWPTRIRCASVAQT
jgi:hypothetical protein